MSKKYKFGVIGAGNMGFAIANGALNAGIYKQNQIILCDRSEEACDKYAKLGFAVTSDANEVYKNSQIVMLAIKPQVFEEVLSTLEKPEVLPLVITIAAGITTDFIKKQLGEIQVIRVMPNTPLLIGIGATALCKNVDTDERHLESVKNIFDSLGTTVVFDDENMLNEVIPTNGSSPAFVYYFMNEMIKSAQNHGINYEDAKNLIIQSFVGSAKMVENYDGDISDLIRAVCSPGGATLEAMKVFDDEKLGDTIAKASDNCIKRSYELAK